MYGWYDFVCFGALFLENFLMLWALLEIEWPTSGSAAKKAADQLEMDELQLQEAGTDPRLEKTEGKVALLIAAHQCDTNKAKQDGLTAALKAGLLLFPPSAIFICDNARSEAPPDDTWKLIQNVYLDTLKEQQAKLSAKYGRDFEEADGVLEGEPLNYIYLPVGNKTISFYWCVDVWMPILEKHKLCTKFEYILMIDDDVCLPSALKFNLRNFEADSDIQAFAYAISAIDVEDPDYRKRALENKIIGYQNLEYLLAGFFKQFQTTYGTTLAAHGAIALWRREILAEQIFWNHDCIFNGEDLQMGLILHGLKKGYKIVSAPREITYTEPPDFTGMLWQQRVKSWDVTQHRMTWRFLRILLFHWCGGISTLILKPFFLLEIFNIVQDWARIFFFTYLLTYIDGIIHFAQWVIYLIILEWIILYFFNSWGLKERSDVRLPWQIYIGYPLQYKPLMQLFRWYALLENIVRYSPTGPVGMTIAEHHELDTMPPTPIGFENMSPREIDWRTIWTCAPDEEEEDNDERQSLLWS